VSPSRGSLRSPLAAHGHTTPAQKCATAKNKAAAKKAAAKLSCYATATTHATPVDAACLTAAETKFGAAIGTVVGAFTLSLGD
jgi:hypothetical protein